MAWEKEYSTLDWDDWSFHLNWFKNWFESEHLAPCKPIEISSDLRSKVQTTSTVDLLLALSYPTPLPSAPPKQLTHLVGSRLSWQINYDLRAGAVFILKLSECVLDIMVWWNQQKHIVGKEQTSRNSLFFIWYFWPHLFHFFHLHITVSSFSFISYIFHLIHIFHLIISSYPHLRSFLCSRLINTQWMM